MAAKRTHELIPLCHPLRLTSVEVSLATADGDGPDDALVLVEATVRARDRTGVEMEALTAVAIACLTVIDMGKAIDNAMIIEGIRVTEKRGGRHGDYTAVPREEGR
jgi:cyclic pyranopterin phosphate synthase